MNRFRNFTACLSAFILLLSSCKKSHDSTPDKVFKNQVAYIYKQGTAEATAYKTLMEDNKCGVTLFDMAHIGDIDFTKFDLVVIGNNTSTDAYDFAGVTGTIAAAGKPLLLIGEGGGHYGEMINADVSWASCSSFAFPPSIIVVDSSTSLYKSPKKISVPANRTLMIFNGDPVGQAFEESIYQQYPTVEKIAQASSSRSRSFSVTFEKGKYGFWGYYNSVNDLNQTGKDFMVNLSYYVGKLKQ